MYSPLFPFSPSLSISLSPWPLCLTLFLIRVFWSPGRELSPINYRCALCTPDKHLQQPLSKFHPSHTLQQATTPASEPKGGKMDCVCLTSEAQLHEEAMNSAPWVLSSTEWWRHESSENIQSDYCKVGLFSILFYFPSLVLVSIFTVDAG